MSTMSMRYQTTKTLLMDPNVTVPEAIVHLYYWVQFERVIRNRNKNHAKAGKYAKILNENLEVFSFRILLAADEAEKHA